MRTKYFGTYRRELEGYACNLIGEMPGEKCIFLSPSAKMTKEGKVAVFRSTLEIIRNGYDVMYIPGQDYAPIIEKAVYSFMEGRIFQIIPKGLGTISKGQLSTVLVTGGGILSLEDDDTLFSIEALSRARSFASSIAEATIFADENVKFIPWYVSDALDHGHCVALLDTSLIGLGARKLLQEGAPCVQSFSFLMENPKYYAVPDTSGRYCLMDVRFAIIDRDGKL